MQAVAQCLGYKERFFCDTCRCIRAHPDAIDAIPTCGSKELNQVLHRPDCHRVILSLRLARYLLAAGDNIRASTVADSIDDRRLDGPGVPKDAKEELATVRKGLKKALAQGT